MTKRPALVASLRLSVAHREPMRVVESANLIVGLGIEGDRHASPRAALAGRQVLLMDEETLASLGLAPGQVRENVTTVGVNLGSLQAGQQVAVGDEAVLEVSGPCEPCERMNEVRPGLRVELEGRRGVLASVVHGGRIRVGDPIRVHQHALPKKKSTVPT